MRTKITLIILLTLSFSHLESQTIEPKQQKVHYCGDSTLIDSQSPEFTQDTVFNGWMWGAKHVISKALGCTQSDNWYNDSLYSVPDYSNMFVRSNAWQALYCDHGHGASILLARAMVFNPALEIPDPITDYYAIANQCDSTSHSSIFGFKYIHPQAYKTDSGLVLLKSRFGGITKILDYPWDLSKLNFGNGEYNPEIDGQDIDDNIQLFNGNKYYLTVNLERVNDTTTTSGTMPALMFKISYYDSVYHGYKTINFATSPNSDTTSITSVMGEYRGAQAGQTNCTTQKDYMQIIKNTIPTDGTPVTYSGYFKFFGATTTPEKYFDNPRKVGNFNVFVTYFDNCDVKINSIKIESLHAKDLFDGQFDTIIVRNVERSMNKFSCTDTGVNPKGDSVAQKHINYFRENISVETGVKCWAAERYFNKLVGNIGISVTGSENEYPVLYDKYVNIPDRWVEMVKFYERISVPYKRGFTDELEKDKSMGIIAGFDETKRIQNGVPVIEALDPLNSEYETYFRYDQSRSEFDALDYQGKLNYIGYNDLTDFSVSVQYYWDDLMKRRYYNKESSGFQYSDKNWWAMNCTLVEYLQAKDDKYYETSYKRRHGDTLPTTFRPYWYFHYYRPLTAEEVRLIDYSQIIMGCKGETYDGALQNVFNDMNNNPPKDTSYRLQLSFDNERYAEYEESYRNDHSSFDFDEFLLDNKVGGDFLDSVYRFIPRLQHTYYLDNNVTEAEKELAAETYLGVPKERCYTGMRSNRWEIHKIHKWMNDNSNTLMDLSLIAWKGKGFLTLYNQHPDSTATANILDRYVYLDSVKTRKKWQADSTLGYTSVAESHKEEPNEQFYDITLLKEDGFDLSDRFYVGCQNRRSDPLINQPVFWPMPGLPGSSNTTYKLCFYTGAELDNFTEAPSSDPFSEFLNPFIFSKEYWRDLYDKRLGYRIMELPLRRIHKSLDERLWGFYVKELTYKYPAHGTTEFDIMRYWLQYEYKNKIENVYLVNQYSLNGYEKIDVPLPSGRGKILRVEPFYQKYNFEILSPKPFINPRVVDTCMYLALNVELIFKKADSSDANNCNYEIYCVNKSDTFNIYVPIIGEFKTYNNLDTTTGTPSCFQYFNLRNDSTFTSVWFPDTVMQDTTFLATYNAHCSNSRVSYKIGTRMCYIEAFLDLPCSICECSDSLKVGIRPINSLNLCRLYPTIAQTKRLNNGDSCKYYGLVVRGGFYPNDAQMISGLSVTPDPLNPQPIDFSTYNRWIDDPFMDMYCYPTCSYNINFSFRNINGEEVSSKDYSITIDNSQFPIDIDPTGILSDQCYSIQPAKRAIPSEELHFEQSIIVDPNPTTGKANVKLNLENDLVGRLVLYTSTGELIKEIYNGKLPAGTSDYQIDLSSQPSGMYIITIESDGMQYIKKFVKE